ncbi:MAG: tetratricopeptide repeat protein [Alphaproteobacteria bacterium]
MARTLRHALIGLAGTAFAGATATGASDPDVEAALAAARQSPGVTATGTYLSGLHAQKRHAYDEAADYLLRALATDPGEPALVQRAFQLLLSEGRFAEALPLGRAVVQRAAGNALANLALAVDAARRGDPAAAEGFLDRMPQSGINRVTTPLMRAWLLADRGRIDEAVAALDPLLSQQSLRSAVALHAALILDRAGRANEAGQRYAAAATAAAGNLRVTQLAANFYLRQGQRDAAADVLAKFAAASGEPSLVAAEQRLAGDPTAKPAPLAATSSEGIAEVLFDVATAANQPQSRDLALIVVRLALELRPDHALGHMLLGDILEDYDRHAAARAVYQRLPASSPLSWSARLRAAVALDRMDRVDDAARELKAMVDERTDRYDAAIRLGDMMRARSRFPEAVEAYDVGLGRIEPLQTRHWAALYSRGIALERSKNWPRAEADFQKALELQPEQPYVLNYLAYSWVDKGLHLERSLAMLQRAVDQRPNDGYIVDSLGWVMYRMQRYDEAVRHLERAVELRPLDPVINDHLGDAYWRAGRRAEARVQWQRALTLNPEADTVGPLNDKLARGLPAKDEAKRPDGG